MKTNLLLGLFALAAGAACGGAPPSEGSDAETDSATTCVAPSLTCQNMSTPPSYGSAIAPLLKERCSPCHFPGGVMDTTDDLSTLDNVRNASTAIINALHACSMPPVKGNALYGIEAGVPGITAEQANAIVDWIFCGAPDN